MSMRRSRNPKLAGASVVVMDPADRQRYEQAKNVTAFGGHRDSWGGFGFDPRDRWLGVPRTILDAKYPDRPVDVRNPWAV